MSRGAVPFNGVVTLDQGGHKIEAAANGADIAAGKREVGYAIEARNEASRTDKDLRRTLEVVERGLKIFEH